MKVVQGIVATVYRADQSLLVHLVNAIGHRPLMNNIPYTDFDMRIAVPENCEVFDVEAGLSDADFTWQTGDGYVSIHVNHLNLWEMFRIRLK